MKDPLAAMLSASKDSFTNRSSGQIHEFYITGQIKDASEYTDWFDTIRHSGEHDFIILYINSVGGNLFTALQFLSVLNDSEATIVVQVEGACMSAATMIMLAGDKFVLSPHSMFMYHNYSGAVVGKGGEMYDNIMFERKWSKDFMYSIYDGFLTKREVEAILNNKDLWLTTHEVAERLRKKAKIVASQMEELLEESNGTDAD